MNRWLIAALVALASATPSLAAPPQNAAPPPTRFDMLVRADFFAGFAGDAARFSKGMEYCERILADNPKHPEALVWHGSGLLFESGQAFGVGDARRGGELWQQGLAQMNEAVALAPDDVGVLIPRGATIITASRQLPPDVARPLLESAVDNYEHVLAIQAPYFSTLGDHPKGELLFGLAEANARLGRADKAREYFERLVKDAPGSGQAPRARDFLATGALPKIEGLGCIGCHK